MSRGVIILLWVVGVIVVALGVAFLFGTNGMKKTLNLQVENVDLTSVPDGTYRGSYEGGRFSNTVDVQVVDHKIVSLKVVKDQVGSKVSQQVFDKVIAKQSPAVDTVSGGTTTWHGYMKAIEIALKSAGGR